MSNRYFVTVIAPDQSSLARLQLYELDLFHSSAHALRTAVSLADRVGEAMVEQDIRIDGLITLEDVGRLVEDGYQVIVKESGAKPTPAQTEIMTFEEWREAMEE
jgi:hypothetical protein